MASMLYILLGILALLAGRKLFWLFVGITGFVLGAQLGATWAGTNTLMALGCGLTLGLLGALLAVFFQTAAFAVAGFIAGGSIVTSLALHMADSMASYEWGIYLAGGIAGALLALAFMDWTIIILSSLFGAGLILTELHLSNTWHSASLIALALVGVAVQAGLHHGTSHGMRHSAGHAH